MNIIGGSAISLYLIAALFALAVINVIRYFFAKLRIYILGNRLPGPKGWPIIGNALEFLERDVDFLEKVSKYNQEHGLMRLWLGPELNVFICSAEDAETYYLSPFLHDRSYHFDFFKCFVGNGLLTASGSHWRKSKRLMEPHFRYSSLRSFALLLNEKADILISLLEKEVGKPVFSIYDHIKNCTFDIITRTMCDMELNSQIQHVKVLENAEILLEYVNKRMFSVWQQYDFLYKFSEIGKDFFQRLVSVQEYLDKMISIKRASYEEGKKNIQDGSDIKDLKHASFVQSLAEQEWSNDEIREHVLTMVATGFETVTSEICFALVLLGIHQEIQEKLYQEIFTSGLYNDLPDKELAKLEYLEKVIKESMRIFPIAPILFRKAKEDVKFGEHCVPKGAAVGINIFAIHRNPEYYENPSIFDPENFSEEKITSRHPFAFIPFGAGIRKCIGEKFAWMVLRIIITKILLKYKIECDIKLEDIQVRLDITLKMKNGFPIRLLKR